MDDFHPIRRALLMTTPLAFLVLIMYFSLPRMEKIRDEVAPGVRVASGGAAFPSSSGSPGPALPPLDGPVWLEAREVTATVTRADFGRLDLLERENPALFARLGEIGGEMASGELSDLGAAWKIVTEFNDSSIQPVDPDVLKSFLPGQIPGWETRSREAGASRLMGISAAAATGSYRDEDGRRLHLRVVDTGTMKDLAALAGGLIGTADLTGTNRTVRIETGTISGHEAFTKTGLKNGVAQTYLMVGGRFMVVATGQGVPAEKIKTVLESLDLPRLAGLAGRSGPPAGPADPADHSPGSQR